MATGRPSKYKPEYAKIAAKLCRFGLTDKDLAEYFEVSVRLINVWKKEQPEFLHSIKRSKKIADAEVADKLFKRAVGYEFTEKTYEYDPGEDKMIMTKKVVKHIPPDTGAQCFWLKNRNPDEWRDKHEVETNVTGDIAVSLNLD